MTKYNEENKSKGKQISTRPLEKGSPPLKKQKTN